MKDLFKALAELHRRWGWDEDVAAVFDKIAEAMPF